MTRDEAIKTFSEKRPSYMTDSAGWIDLCVALGMLKLDEPKSADERIKDAMGESGYAFLCGTDFIKCMEKRGLKIVEK